ncbi:unnamed protein product [Urochloa humidicola]
MDAGETHYAQAEVVRASKAKFDEQLSRMYTRAVYKEYKTQYNNSTAFIIEPNTDERVKNGYLVKHETGEGNFCWAQHAFRVIADKEAGEYKCECKQWEHTGLFCMHIIKAFTHLQVRRIPEKYILKRYTRDAVSDVHWDRHDNVRIGQRASKEQTRLSKLLPKLMRLGRAGSRSDFAYEETIRLLAKITPGIEMFEREIDDESAEPIASATGVVATTNASDHTSSVSPQASDPLSTVIHEGMMLVEPTVSRTKGRNSSKQKKDIPPQVKGNPHSTYTQKNHGKKECRCCGVRGSHYSTTCPLNPERSTAVEERANKKITKTQDGAPRKRGRPKIVRDLHDGNDENIGEVVPASQASSTGARGRGASGRGRGPKALRVSYQE